MTEPHYVCDAAALAERGDGVRFDVLRDGELVCAFVLRFDGAVHGYLNRCAHVAMEMDWQPGKFLEGELRYIMCATHGACYEPSSGYCVAGPCRGARLVKLDVREEGGVVNWYPDARTVPVFDPSDSRAAS
jgi:nitrite reductase/ring-hydroxylating ferredoxin subunit